ncbi:TIGR03808 family TAT-translocated repetitive protein [Polymorphum gilvum]|uniref:Carbohydrate-binding and sugar hydrolysis n=1 Tax=Polymorphum gilvum (strain LMG 25793 / CGMCC 1.9160 / SL003B-26A1) TaxID=991905 RepID=F2IV85_POLGS|nr:TIGR03808 family TAT-translocated repetitive protein [Polymorphum gilvum]ADZ71416.1 Carbohydrate-binding and sugar hydrolysis [Polymorphum gilvum SL003B-26A1]
MKGIIARPMSRRALLGGAALCLSGTATRALTQVADLRGTIDAADLGVVADAVDDQTVPLQAAIDRAAERGRALFLPAGRYPVADLALPSGTLIVGVPGRTRLVYRGGGGLLATAEGGERIGLDGLVFDGANKSLAEHAFGLLHFRAVDQLTVTDCEILGSSRSGLALDRCSGHVSRCLVSGAAEAGIRSVEARGLSIADNTVSDCANGGILVLRWSPGEDGTLVTGNRIERIAARAGGTGQNGNGINVFRADGVLVANNRVADCAFSAIRSNAGSNVQILGNACLRSGETAIYSEFGFEGAVIANNLVDGATMGISIANFMDGGRLAVCSGNIVRNLKSEGPYPPEVAGFGIGIAVEADTTVTGNVIEGAPKFGLLLGWGPYLRDVVATQNVIRDCATGIAVTVVEGAGPAIVADNLIRGARDTAIAGYRWLDRVTGDLALAGADAFPHLTLSGNRAAS